MIVVHSLVSVMANFQAFWCMGSNINRFSSDVLIFLFNVKKMYVSAFFSNCLSSQRVNVQALISKTWPDIFTIVDPTKLMSDVRLFI